MGDGGYADCIYSTRRRKTRWGGAMRRSNILLLFSITGLERWGGEGRDGAAKRSVSLIGGYRDDLFRPHPTSFSSTADEIRLTTTTTTHTNSAVRSGTSSSSDNSTWCTLRHPSTPPLDCLLPGWMAVERVGLLLLVLSVVCAGRTALLGTVISVVGDEEIPVMRWCGRLDSKKHTCYPLLLHHRYCH